jgi:hypothetical protein
MEQMTDTSERGMQWVPEVVSNRAAFRHAIELGVNLKCSWCGDVIAGPVGTATNGSPIHFNACTAPRFFD